MTSHFKFYIPDSSVLGYNGRYSFCVECRSVNIETIQDIFGVTHAPEESLILLNKIFFYLKKLGVLIIQLAPFRDVGSRIVNIFKCTFSDSILLCTALVLYFFYCSYFVSKTATYQIQSVHQTIPLTNILWNNSNNNNYSNSFHRSTFQTLCIFL